ncbi:hypothetical protein ACT3OH_05155 [Vreelandella zhanjiangensis]|uniref:hypothetical protein n=1 Tax=Vreelandella zhanjiangensis TaxID=1121960 RepID=UPI00402B00C9
MVEKEQHLKFLSFLALPYALSVALGWSLGFWQTFGINPFEYAGPAELISLSAYALAASLSVALVIFFFMPVFMDYPGLSSLPKWFEKRFHKRIGAMPELPSEEDFTHDKMESYDKEMEKFKKRLRRIGFELFATRFLIMIIILAIAIFSYYKKSSLLLSIFALSPITFLIVADPLPKWIKESLANNNLAEIILCIMISFPAVAFIYGAQKAFEIQEGKGAMLLFDVKEENMQKGGIYIGRMGDHIFTYDVCSTFVEVKKDDELPQFKLVSNAIVKCDDFLRREQNIEY